MKLTNTMKKLHVSPDDFGQNIFEITQHYQNYLKKLFLNYFQLPPDDLYLTQE